MDRFKRIPVREQEPKVRATNFEEVCLGYNEEEAVAEASRCLNCPKPRCVGGCPVGINIPGFIAKVKERDFEGAAKRATKLRFLKHFTRLVLFWNMVFQNSDFQRKQLLLVKLKTSKSLA